MSLEVDRINNMDLHQLLLKTRNLKRHRHMSKLEYEQQYKALNDNLQVHGYTIVQQCCGRIGAEKINKE